MQDKTFSDYVCSECFRRLDECVCPTVPKRLLQIDAGIQEPIRILNDKGWTTEYCCEGHYNPEQKRENMYVSFPNKRSAPPYFPDEWAVHSSKNGQVVVYGEFYPTKKPSTIPEKKKIQFIEGKTKRMSELLQWAEGLPENAQKTGRHA